MMNSTATCSTRRGVVSARLYFARDSPCDENKQPHHTGSVAAGVKKERAFHRTPERRCQVCYWCIIKDPWKRQHHQGIWNARTLRAAGNLQELTHEMDRYRWNVLVLCEMRWKNFGETKTEERNKVVGFVVVVFFSGKEDKHEHGVGFLVHKDIVNTVTGCRPVSSRLITIHLRAVPFNIATV